MIIRHCIEGLLHANGYDHEVFVLKWKAHIVIFIYCSKKDNNIMFEMYEENGRGLLDGDNSNKLLEIDLSIRDESYCI